MSSNPAEETIFLFTIHLDQNMEAKINLGIAVGIPFVNFEDSCLNNGY